MKKDRRGQTGAKIAAWIGITLAGCLAAGSVVGIVAMEEEDIYNYSRDAFQERMYESVADHYAVRVLSALDQPEDDKSFDIYYRYGVIKAENIDDIDLADENVYLEKNFDEPIVKEDLYLQRYEVGKNSEVWDSGTLFGGYGIYNNVESYFVQEPVQQIIYNKEDGIFYYDTSGGFYPVQMVELECPSEDASYGMEWYSFYYDFALGMYRNARYAPEETITDGGSAENVAEVAEVPEAEARESSGLFGGRSMTVADTQPIEPVQESGNVKRTPKRREYADYETAKEVLAETYITFDMFDGTDFAYEDWGEVSLDGTVRELAFGLDAPDGEFLMDEDSIWVVEDGYMSGKAITEDEDYNYIDAGEGRIEVNRMDSADEETYWIAAQIPESVGLGWNQDLFVQANMVISLAYAFRYSIYLILLAALALALFCFAFLLRAAGHRKGTDAIVESWLDKMPFDIYLGFAGVAEIFLIKLVESMCYYIDRLAGIVAFAALLVVMCWVMLLSILTFTVRIKRGKWWKNTVIWWILHGLYSAGKAFVQNIGLFYKALLVIGGISLVELFVILAFGYRTRNVGIFWFLEKIILIPLLLFTIFQMQKLKEGGEKLAEGDLHHQIDTERMFWEFKQHGENLNSISEGMSRAVDERMKSEYFKTELITNVSHDIKTPLTSIINYVDLLEKEELKNEKAVEYLEVLDRQSGRLKKLIEDLIEASKASTGSLAVHLENLEAGVSLVQTVGEFEEKLKANKLELLIKKPENPVYILADGRHYWRVIDNLMNNICKYAQPATRVYIDLDVQGEMAVLTFRNTSKYPLNITSEELMERFVRGDSSRNTEGSGLGISIAKSLMELMGGTFELYVDGDLFKVVLGFPLTHR